MKVTAMSFAKLLKEMIPGDLTRAELAEETGLSIDTVRVYTKMLHKEGVIHIASWGQDAANHHSLAYFRLGPGKDRPKPIVKNKDYVKVYRKRMRDAKLLRILEG